MIPTVFTLEQIKDMCTNQYKAQDFVFRDKFAISQEASDFIYDNFEYKSVDAIEDIDNPEYEWKCVFTIGSDTKYGRDMVSFTRKIRRGLTMGEFYGGGIVD